MALSDQDGIFQKFRVPTVEEVLRMFDGADWWKREVQYREKNGKCLLCGHGKPGHGKRLCPTSVGGGPPDYEYDACRCKGTLNHLSAFVRT